MRKHQISILIVLVCLGFTSCNNNESQLFLGLEPPTDSAIIFAPDIICFTDRFEQSITFSPDFNDIVFGTTNQYWNEFKMYSITFENGNWSESKEIFSNGIPGGIAPMFSPDGNRLYHSASRTTYPYIDIFYTTKIDTGWAEAVKMEFPVNSDSIEFEISESEDRTLYFSSTRPGCQGEMDIFYSELEDGQYKKAQRMSDNINSDAGDDCPFIAPDESYIIFTSDKEGGYGFRDIYISFRNDDKTWTEAINLGPKVNSEFWDIYPSVSPDGKYLFFTRREKWWESSPSNIYWISTAVFKELQTKS
jgi:Tol biopolymer transport system component